MKNGVFASLFLAAALIVGACNNDNKTAEADTRDATDANKTDNDNPAAKTTDTITRQLADSAVGNSASSNPLDSNDARFAREMTENNYAEIKMAQLAQTKSSNAEVKTIAKMLEEDHTAALNALKSAVGSSTNLPASETKKQMDNYEKFSKKDANKFDKDWCKEMMDAHSKSIDKLEKEQSKTNNTSIKNWISQVLPKIHNHHDKLVACHEKLK